MNELEKIKKYIEQTRITNKNKYCMYMSEAIALKEFGEYDFCKALFLAFSYGQAKGYRAAKKEASV